MRNFVVLGFASTSNSEQGELIHLGSDRGEALAITNARGKFARQELFELARPHKVKHFEQVVAEPVAKKSKKA